MKLKVIGIVVFSLVMVSSLALADSLLNTNGGTWLTVPAPNGSAPPFWDNASMDGGKKNVGYILTGTNDTITDYHPTGGISTQLNWLGGFGEYLGIGPATTGSVVDNVHVQTLTNPTKPSGVLIVTVAGNSGSNSFGVYDMAATVFAGNHLEIFPNGGANPPPNGQPFTVNIPYASYGFYLDGPGGLFLSDPSKIGTADSNSNFAFFQNTSLNPPSALFSTYFIGMEDLTQSVIAGREGALGDFNDMVIEISIPSNVPVPPTALLLGTGLLGLVGLRSWRKKA